MQIQDILSAQDYTRLKIGTSGYSYDDWRGNFYPERLPKSDMLSFYCQFFNTVEINSTYYRIPNAKLFERLNAKTPDSFEFIVKTHQEMTHRRKEYQESFENLLKAVRPIMESEKFRGFLAQFPYSFKNNESNRAYLATIRKIAGDAEIFVEFRNKSWLVSQIPAFLEQHKLGYVNVDEPAIPGLLPPQNIATTHTGYIRLHGRNEKDWWQGQGSSRYFYAYTPEQLNDWLIHISRILKKTYKTYIFFNNHPVGNAVKNAQQLIKLLENINDNKTE